jgi:hypothetical protein
VLPDRGQRDIRNGKPKVRDGRNRNQGTEDDS